MSEISGSGKKKPSPSDPQQAASDRKLLRTLLRLARDIAQSEPPRSVVQRRNFASFLRKAALLSFVFEDLLRLHRDAELPSSASLCLREILSLLRRLANVLDTCSVRMSRVRLALQYDAVAASFHDLARELSTLLDLLPVADLRLPADAADLVELLRAQCRKSPPDASSEERLRGEILEAIADVEREKVPDPWHLQQLFGKLGLDDPALCKEEIDRLEVEIRDGAGGRWSASMISLLGLVRYSKFVLFGASTPRAAPVSRSPSMSEASIPADFRCPISLELIKDPVVAASGHTYDRASIERWIGSGHSTCPKTGQALAHLRLVPNHAFRNLILQWCREHNVPYSDPTAGGSGKQDAAASATTKAASEAGRMTAVLLVDLLRGANSEMESNRIVHELRQLAKTASDSREYIAEAGAIPLLVPLLGSEDQGLQVNAVTALLNLSILESNKKKIMKTQGALAGVAAVLRGGVTWQARENAAATLLSVSSLHPLYRRRVGKEDGVPEGLAELVAKGPASSKRDGLVTLLHLAGTRENTAALVEGGAVEAAVGAAGDGEVGEMAVAVLAALAKRGAVEWVARAEGFVPAMVWAMRNGSDQAKEAAIAALVSVCRLGRPETMEELRRTAGLEWLLLGLMSTGSARARRKAATLVNAYRKWVSKNGDGNRRGAIADIATASPAQPTAAQT